MSTQNYDFSYQSYGRLLDTVKDIGYKFSFILDNEKNMSDSLTMYLRHDVDTDYLGCLPLAQIEASKGIYSTWYFLFTSSVYNILSPEIIDIMKNLIEMGHVVGLHVDATLYNSFNDMKMECDRVFDLVSRQLSLSRTLSFHKPAQWLLNQTIAIPGWTNAYSYKYYSSCIYVSDSNRREFWKEERFEHILLKEGSACMLFHPFWWHEQSLSPDEVFLASLSYLGSDRIKEYISDCCKRYSKEKVISKRT